jgi:hypothetical protein
MKSRGLLLLITFCLTLFGAGCSSEPEILDTIGTTVAQAVALTQETYTTQSQGTIRALRTTINVTPTYTITSSPTNTPTQTPSLTASPTETYTPTPTEIPTETPIGYIPEDAIWFYVVKVEAGDTNECGGSLIKLWTGYVRSGNITTDLTNALNTVFSVGQYAGGYYNATYPSNLRVKAVEMSGDGTASVFFDGSFVPPKDSCEASRFRSQVWGTALQFPEVTRFIPWIGDKLLGDRLAAFSDSGK